MLQFSQRAVMAAFVMWLALLGVNHSANIIDKIEELQSIITTTIAGDEFKNPEKMLDGTLVLMQMMGNKLESGLSDTPDSKTMLNTGLLFVTGMGQALPALISGGLLLLNRIALYLCIMFAPLCLAAYLFESTRFMFVTWAKFTVSTLFSMAVITVIVVIAIKAVLFVTAALMLAEMTGGVDLKSIATAQGGVGMLLTTLVLGGPPLVTNFFSGQVAAAFGGYNPVGSTVDAALKGSSPAAGPQDMDRANRGGGANTQQNQQGINSNDLPAQEGRRTMQNNALQESASGIKTTEQAQRAVNRSDAGGNYSTGTPSGGANTARSYAATNAAEERTFAAQKAQQSSTAGTTASHATGATTSTASAGTTTASTGNTSTVSNSASSDSSVRLANTGIGDDSIAIKQQYAGRMGINSPNRTTS